MKFILPINFVMAKFSVPFVESFCKSLRERCLNTEFFSGLYFPVFSQKTGKYGPEKLRIWTLFILQVLQIILNQLMKNNVKIIEECDE